MSPGDRFVEKLIVATTVKREDSPYRTLGTISESELEMPREPTLKERIMCFLFRHPGSVVSVIIDGHDYLAHRCSGCSTLFHTIHSRFCRSCESITDKFDEFKDGF